MKHEQFIKEYYFSFYDREKAMNEEKVCILREADDKVGLLSYNPEMKYFKVRFLSHINSYWYAMKIKEEVFQSWTKAKDYFSSCFEKKDTSVVYETTVKEVKPIKKEGLSKTIILKTIRRSQ